MTKNILKPIIKITILTTLFFWLITMWNQALSWWFFNDTSNSSNNNNFVSTDSTELSEIWVALSINIWTKFYEQNFNSDILYNEVLPLSIIESNSQRVKEILINKNLEAIKDYSNLMKINIKWYLDSWDNREESYNSLLNQLKIRYKTWYVNAKNLTLQRDSLVNSLKLLTKSIENTKQGIWTNMKNYNVRELWSNIDQYIELKNRYNVIRTYAVFSDKFLSYYKVLNSFNMNLINSLRLNKSAIIWNTYIVIPSSWDNLLRELNLIYDESDIWADGIWVNINQWELQNYSSNNWTNSSSSDNTWNSSIFWWLMVKPSEIKNTDASKIQQTWNIDFWSNKLWVTWN